MNYEFILFVNTGGEERQGMSRQTWNLFSEKLIDLVMTRVFDDLPVLRIDWSNLVGELASWRLWIRTPRVLTKQLESEIEVAEHKSKNEPTQPAHKAQKCCKRSSN